MLPTSPDEALRNYEAVFDPEKPEWTEWLAINAGFLHGYGLGDAEKVGPPWSAGLRVRRGYRRGRRHGAFMRKANPPISSME